MVKLNDIQPQNGKTQRTRGIAFIPEQTIDWLRIPAMLLLAVAAAGLSKALSQRAAVMLDPVNLPGTGICIALLCAAAVLYATLIIARFRLRIDRQDVRPDCREKLGLRYRWRSF